MSLLSPVSAALLFVLAAAFALPLHAEPAGPVQSPETALRRMIGQMIMVGFTGADENSAATVIKQAEEGKITGVVHLARNIRSLDQVRLLNQALQLSSSERLLIAVDQEGGRIERLTDAIGFEEMPGAEAVAASMSPDRARISYEGLASRLADLGFNVNLGPVVDLNLNPANPIIGRLGRSFSADPATVAAYARAFVEGHRAKGVLASLKHFPGHGSSVGDTHEGNTDVTESWTREELLPYKDLIASGDADVIMSGHVINDRLSGSAGVPSSLSRKTLTALLREDMRFEGVVISDDLQMRAIADGTSFDDAVRDAVLAGNDILLFANDKNPDPLIPDKVATILFGEALRSPAMLEQIRAAHGRIQRLKQKLSSATSEGQ